MIPIMPALEDKPRLRRYLDEVVPRIDREMFRYLPEAEPLAQLYAPMRDYPLRGGKRFRSAMVLLACEALGGPRDRALPAAAAFEMFQSFALVHDDIEDGSEIRRGKPCLHRIHGIPLSLNVGDALYAKVFEILLSNRRLLGEGTTLNLISEMVDGSRETFEGQAYDIGWAGDGGVPTVEMFMTMLRKKTGWYSGRGPCTAGAIIAGANPGMVREIGSFGEAIAIAFQLRDDLLNIQVTEGEARRAPGATSGGYGKEWGGDIAEGKRTLMVIDLLNVCDGAERTRALEILDRDRDRNTPEEIEWVIARMTACGAVARAQEACARKAGEALTHLDRLPGTEARETLREMAAFLVERIF
jgi:geranylgeranyl diphosphate synthase, type II